MPNTINTVSFEGVSTRQSDLKVELEPKDSRASGAQAAEELSAETPDLAPPASWNPDIGYLSYTGWSMPSLKPPGLMLKVEGLDQPFADSIYEATIRGDAAHIARLFGLPAPPQPEEEDAVAAGPEVDAESDPVVPSEGTPAPAPPEGPWSIVDAYGMEPLAHAANSGHAAAVDVLLDAKADVNASCSDGRTALHRAATQGHVAAVEALIAKGAIVNAETHDELTPLHLASADGHLSAVKALLTAGASTSATDGSGATSLMLAAQAGSTEVINALLDAGAALEVKDHKGWSVLHYATTSGDHAMASLLAERGADIHAW